MTNNLEPEGVDFHCHLDLYPDHQSAIERAEAARIYTLTVTTTPRAWIRNSELTRDARYVQAALGMHPQLVVERAGELALWEHHLPEARYIGEVGLDAGPRFYRSLEAQKYVFRTVLEKCAKAGGKILTVHSVRAVTAVLDMIEQLFPQDRGTVVLHWFTGSNSEARRAVALGCYFSINGEMTRSNRGRPIVAGLPMDRILTETDGPFTRIDGRPTHPSDIPLVAEAIARVRQVTSEEVGMAINANLHALLATRDNSESASNSA